MLVIALHRRFIGPLEGFTRAAPLLRPAHRAGAQTPARGAVECKIKPSGDCQSATEAQSDRESTAKAMHYARLNKIYETINRDHGHRQERPLPPHQKGQWLVVAKQREHGIDDRSVSPQRILE